jgi:hypothetical protein
MRHERVYFAHNGERSRAESAWSWTCSCGAQESARTKADCEFEWRMHKKATDAPAYSPQQRYALQIAGANPDRALWEGYGVNLRTVRSLEKRGLFTVRVFASTGGLSSGRWNASLTDEGRAEAARVREERHGT